MGGMLPADADLVSVFRTDDLALLPLARLALEAEQIEYIARGPGAGAEWTHATLGSSSRNAGWVEIVVAADVAARARELLGDLQQADAVTAVPDDPGTPLPDKEASGPETIELHDVDTGAPLGRISEGDLQRLMDELEEDESQPQEYYIDAGTVELLEQSGAGADLIALLTRAIAGREGVQIRWSR